MNARSAAGDAVFHTLDAFRIELPSWGFANTGTRFGKYLQPAAATTTEEKLRDAAHVHAVTGVCPTVALHVQWDFPRGVATPRRSRRWRARAGVAPGAINPNFFQDQDYKHGSFGNPDPAVRAKALDHCRESIAMPAASAAATCRSGSPTARTIRARRTSGSGSAGSRRR